MSLKNRTPITRKPSVQIPSGEEILIHWNDHIVERESPLIVAERFRFLAGSFKASASKQAAEIFNSYASEPMIELTRSATFEVLEKVVDRQGGDGHIALPVDLANWALLELAASTAQQAYDELAPLMHFLTGDNAAVDVESQEGFDYLFNHFCAFMQEGFPALPTNKYPIAFAGFLERCALPVPPRLARAIEQSKNGTACVFRLVSTEGVSGN